MLLCNWCGQTCSGSRLEESNSGQLAVCCSSVHVDFGMYCDVRLCVVHMQALLVLQVPQSEIDDIESQIRDLTEVEEMQEEWELQAEAQDELETLLRVS